MTDMHRWRAAILGAALALFGAAEAAAQQGDRARTEAPRFGPLLRQPVAGPPPVYRITPVQSPRLKASAGRRTAQVLAGAVGAVVIGVVAFRIWDDPYGADRRVKGDAGYTPAANTAYAVGSFLGATAASYLVGRADGSRASLAATALGASAATVPLLLGRDEPYTPVLGVLFGAPLQGLGAMIGYQATRTQGP